MENIEHRTSNAERRMMAAARRHWMFDVRCSMFGVPKSLLIFLIRAYRWTLSPAQIFLFGGNFGCRFSPTCSAYAIDALREHGAIVGTVLTAKRICRCQPWGGCGHDPVPKAESGKRKAEKNLAFGNSI
jgi:putative membrane protein insertion efficiency factor